VRQFFADTTPLRTPAFRRGTPGWGFTAVLEGFRYLAGNRVVLMSFVVDRSR
jgi:hypothetical protein